MPDPRSVTRRPRLNSRLKAVLAIYLFAAALLPLSHHDIVCHAKSTTHCSTCTIGSSGEAAPDPAHLARLELISVGEAVSRHQTAPVSAALSLCVGRAPPAPTV